MKKVQLTGLTWDDPRGYGPLRAVEWAYNNARSDVSLTITWDVQLLSGFESRPLEEVTEKYDLIIADHPHIADAAERGFLIPMEDLPKSYVGLTRESYRYGNYCWAVPVDAACHVCAYHPDRLNKIPQTWAEVEQLASAGARIGMPLLGVHGLMGLFAIVASQQASEPKTFITITESDVQAALDHLDWLRSICIPESLMWNPIDALNALAEGRCDYLPITFGYAHYQSQGIRFEALPAFGSHRHGRGVLGGAGMAVSSRCKHADIALDFSRFCGSSEVQSNVWPTGGGQPAHRSAWNRLSPSDHFYRDTRLAIGTALLRPRCEGFNEIQSYAGSAIQAWLESKDRYPTSLYPTLERVQREMIA